MASTSQNVNVDSRDNDYDIIIIGSGLTGLTAAYSILKRNIGLTVLILESNDIAGGRILLEKNSQAFYGNLHQEKMVKLVDELNVTTETGPDVSGKRFVFFTKNGPLPEEISSLVSGQVYHFFKLLEAISTDRRYANYGFHEDSKAFAEISIIQLLHKSVYLPQAQLICRSLLYACCGIAELENVSALWFIVMLHGAGGFFRKLSSTAMGCGAQRFFIKGGFVHLVRELERRILAEGGTIKFSETVDKIVINGDTVHVSSALKKFKCNYVVIAVPPPSSIRIAVEPALPEFLLESLNRYESAENLFFYATYREPFWAENLSGSMISTADSGSCLRIIYDATHPAGQQIRVVAGLLSAANESSSTQHSIFRVLKKCFRTRKASRCISFNAGSWNNRAPGRSLMYAMQPSYLRYHINPMLVPFERIFFAGSEYATSWPGTADGAIEAGEAVACSITYRARPQALDRAQIITCGSSRRQSERFSESFSNHSGIAKAHIICFGLNVCLFFFLLRDAYENH